MPNYNDLVYTGADYKLFFTITNGAVNGTYSLKTTDSIAFNTAVEDELIHFVGDTEAGANKKNARKRTGKLTIQNGELGDILAIEGLLDATYIDGAILGATALQGVWHKTWSGLNINTESLDIKAKEKQTPITCDFTALKAS